MRTIAIEEHCRTAAVLHAMSAAGGAAAREGQDPRFRRLEDLGAGRIAEMDAAGISLQVLSHTASPVETLAPAEAVPLAREANDQVAEAVRAHPDRFAGFAALPITDPESSADELERTVRTLGFRGALVNGCPQGRCLDDPAFGPLLERAEALGVPLYLHPGVPGEGVRQAYYSGLGPQVDLTLSTSGWGWHIETGLHALRLILGGVFDRFPRLQVIIGHMGEAVPFMLARSDKQLNRVSGLQRPVADYFREHFYITTSGIFTHPPLLCAMLVLGSDRIIFSVDYPYSTNGEGRSFLDTAPVSPADLEKIAHGNAERLLGV